MFDAISNIFTGKEGWNKQGQVYFDQGKYDAAIECYDKALSSKPENGRSEYGDNKRSYLGKGKCLFAKGDYDGAFKCFDKAENCSETHGFKGLILLHNGFYDEAINYLRQALNGILGNIQVLTGMGDAIRKKGYYCSALYWYELAIKENPNHKQAQDGKTEALKNKEQNKIDYVKKGNTFYLKNNYSEASWCYAEAISSDPNNAAGCYNRGLVSKFVVDHYGADNYFKESRRLIKNLETERKFEKLIFYCDQILEIDPKNYDAQVAKQNVLRIKQQEEEQKKQAERERQRQEAERYYQALRSKTELEQRKINYFNNGNLFYQQNNYDDAIKCYEAALQCDPYYVLAWNNMGLALSCKFNYDGALACFENALRIDANCQFAREGRENALFQKNKILEAQRQQQEQQKQAEAERLQKESIRQAEVEQRKINCIKSGNVFYQEGKYDEAIRCYEEAIAYYDPNYTQAWNNKGLALAAKGHYDEALTCLDKALSIDPNFKPSRDGKAQVFIQKNKTLEIQRQQEAKKRPEADQCKIDYINSGNTNYQQNNYDEAIKWYEKALSIDPNYQPAREGKENALKQLNNKLELERQKNEQQKQIYMTIDSPYNKYIHLSKQQKIKRLLDAIGKEDNDAIQIGNIHVTRREVADSIIDENNYYTADFINILLHPLNQPNSQIRAYPAITIDNLDQYYRQIQTQNERYSFIPINIEYDAKSSKHKNHWVALIIDKQNELIFYLDPAQKTAAPKPVTDLKNFLGYKKPIILNPIDFQKKEKEEGWVRHCGPDMVEVFNTFKKNIQKGQCIAGGITPDPTIANSISVQTALSVIPCGEAEIINEIREEHIEAAYKCLTEKSINVEEVQSTASSSQSEILRDIPTPSISSANPSALFDEMKTLKRAYEKLEQKSQETVTAQFTAAEKEKIVEELNALRPLIDVLDTNKFGKGLLGQFYILLRIHLKELFTAASNLSSKKVKRADYLVKDKVKNSLGAFAKGVVPFAEALDCASDAFIELLETASKAIHISELVENALETAGFDPIIKKGIATIFGPSEEKKLKELSSLAIDNTHQDIMMEKIACRLTESYKPIINYLETQGLEKEGIKALAQHASQRIWGVLRRNPHIKDLERDIDLVADQLVAWVSHYPLSLTETIKDKLKTYFNNILTLQQGNQEIPLTAYAIFSHAGVTYFSKQKACWQYYGEKEDSLHATIGFRKVTSEIGQQIVENPTSFYAKYWEKVKPVSPFIQDPENTTSASQENVKALESKINEVAQKTKEIDKKLNKIQPPLPTINNINITVGAHMQQIQNTTATRKTSAAASTAQNKHFNSTLQEHGKQLGLFGETLAQHNEKLEKLENSDNGRLQKISFSSVDRFCQQAVASINNYIETNQSKIKAATFDLPLFSEPMTFFYTKKLSEEKENLARRLIQSLNRATRFSEIKTVLESYLQEDKRLSHKYEKNPDTLSEKINNLIKQVKLELSATNAQSSTDQLRYG